MTSTPCQSDQIAFLRVSALRVELDRGDDIVSDVTFDVRAGEIVGIVGESGSGKTTIAAALLGHAREGARIVGGVVALGEHANILSLSKTRLGAVRGRVVSYVSQDPATGLNPALRLSAHLNEVLLAHEPSLTRAGRNARVRLALEDVGLPSDAEFLARFPHQLSGGQQQRALLALAFLTNPKLIVLDEPTTALDVTTQAKILQTIRVVCRKHGAAAVYISHDLAIVRNLVDRVIVLYAGRIVESGPSDVLFSNPAHPYTRGLLEATPSATRSGELRPIAGEPAAPGARPSGCAFAPRCPRATAACAADVIRPTLLRAEHEATCVHPISAEQTALRVSALVQPGRRSAGVALLTARGIEAAYATQQVLFDVNLDLFPGECVALVGESGSGKTTLARGLAGLGDQFSGHVELSRTLLPNKVSKRECYARNAIQYVFQNPYRALNPTQPVGQILTTVVRHFFGLNTQEAEQRAALALERVALRRDTLDLYPRELSGGERQRVAIARAIVCEPQVLICDEVTSALDVSVQATILQLLRELQDDGLALLFVTHDLGVARSIADHVVVLRNGRVVESGPASEVLSLPSHDYTRELLRNSPVLPHDTHVH